jgi:hypothetical protein
MGEDVESELMNKGESAFTITLIGVIINMLAFWMPFIIPHVFTQYKNVPSYAVFILFLNFGVSSVLFLDRPKPHVDSEGEIRFKQLALTVGAAIYFAFMSMVILALCNIPPFNTLGVPPLPLSILDTITFIAVAISYAATLSYTYELASYITQ